MKLSAAAGAQIATLYVELPSERQTSSNLFSQNTAKASLGLIVACHIYMNRTQILIDNSAASNCCWNANFQTLNGSFTLPVGLFFDATPQQHL